MKYIAKFTGRTVGAIGIFYPITADTQGDTPEEARLNLYDRYEHISGLTLRAEDGSEYRFSGSTVEKVS